MFRSIQILLSVLLAAVCLFWSGAVLADTDAKAEARASYQRAMAHAQAERYAEAALEFERAYALSPHYSVLYNLGRVYSALSRSLEAIDAYERFLSEGGSAVSAERRSEVALQISHELTKVAWLSLEIMPHGALISLDGKPLGLSPLSAPQRVSAGEHTLLVTLAGHAPVERVIALAAGKRETFQLELAKAPASAAEEAEAQKPELRPVVPVVPRQARVLSVEAERAAKLQRNLGYGVAGAGVASIAVGSYFLIVRLNKQNDYEQVCSTGLGCSASDVKRANELSAEIYDSGTIAVATLSAGGVALLSGAALVLLSPKSPPATQKGSAVIPVVTGSFAGATWRGRW
jgi:hypothetical protein